jgi:hypothetical protein
MKFFQSLSFEMLINKASPKNPYGTNKQNGYNTNASGIIVQALTDI